MVDKPSRNFRISPYRITTETKKPRKISKHQISFWSKTWPYIMIFLAVTVSVALVALEQAYKRGNLTINYSNYIATSLAGIISVGILLSYLHQVYKVYKSGRQGPKS